MSDDHLPRGGRNAEQLCRSLNVVVLGGILPGHTDGSPGWRETQVAESHLLHINVTHVHSRRFTDA
jgi:hypothetical protein